MNLELNFDEMLSQCNKLSNLIGQYRSTYSDLKSNLRTYSMWTGKDSTAYNQQVGDLESSLSKMISNLETVTEKIKEAANGYKAVSETIAEHSKLI